MRLRQSAVPESRRFLSHRMRSWSSCSNYPVKRSCEMNLCERNSRAIDRPKVMNTLASNPSICPELATLPASFSCRDANLYAAQLPGHCTLDGSRATPSGGRKHYPDGDVLDVVPLAVSAPSTEWII